MLDDFLRPVEWILSSSKEPRLVVLSPFEANALINDYPSVEVCHIAYIRSQNLPNDAIL
jgi:hypothetical protein